MGIYVPGYEHDVFVSYAHVDDEPLPGVDRGWVTTLVQALNTRLAQILGRTDNYSLWMDYKLRGNDEITPEILASLRGSATLLAVLSPGYLASTWCEHEAESFVEGGNRDKRSIFMVERASVSERPREFQDLRGYRFWVAGREGEAPRTLGSPKPSPSAERDFPYYDQLTKLSIDIADELKRQAGGNGGSGSAEAVKRPTVFLAEVTDDLDERRDEARSYFKQVGMKVLPEAWYVDFTPKSFQEALDADLASSKVFVQLLSDLSGKRGFVSLQHQRARAAELPILQWRDPGLDTKTVEDEDHRALLEQNTVLAISMEEFKQTVRSKTFSKPETPKRKIRAFVFMNTETGDRELARRVGEALNKYGVTWALPMEGGTPAERREDLRQNLVNCNALIIIYATSGVRWVREQLRLCSKVLIDRSDELRAIAVYEGPPPAPKDPLDFVVPGMSTLHCSESLDTKEFRVFLNTVDPGEDG